MVEYLLSTNKEGPENKEPAKNGGIPTVYASNSDPVLELVSEVPGYESVKINHIKIRVPAATQSQFPVDEKPPKEEGNTDAHLQIVLSPKDDETLGKPSGTTVDIWQVRTKEGSINQGGHLYFTAGGYGSLTGNMIEVESLAADAAGFVLDAGMVRGPELKAGNIHHALFAAINTCRKEKGTSVFVFPASHSDCSTEGITEAEEAAIPAMGQRFYLAYSDKEIEELATKEKFLPWKVTILKALSHYGFYVGDSGNPAIALKWEDANMYTAFGVESPFNEIGKEQAVEKSGANYLFNLMKGVEWSRLKAIGRPAPAAITEAASTIKSTEATLNGTVNPEALETKYYFEYGKTTAYGTKTTEVSAGSGKIDIKENKTITGLLSGTTYHFRIVSTSSAGTTDGEDRTFTTLNPSWSLQSTPNPVGASESALYGVSCTSSIACAAVGRSSATETALAEGWNGTEWSIQATSSPSGATLFSVSCASATKCTAVGQSQSSESVTLAEAWNGTEWTVQSTPNPTESVANTLSGVSCTSSTACTAVGHAYLESSINLAERWNGTEWKIESVPSPPGAKGSMLQEVSCSSSTACTAVGDYDNSSGVNVTLAERWNGTEWKIQATPNPTGSTDSYLESISCWSSTECIATGSYQATETTTLSLAERWNGTEWTILSSKNPEGATVSVLDGVSCVSSTACTAVGIVSKGLGGWASLAEYWNGTTWSIQTTPEAKESRSSAVSCSTAVTCTAVGEYDNSLGTRVTLAESYH